MKINEYTLSVGLKQPLTVYHMTDNHLTRADEREDDRKLQLAAKRGAAFAKAEHYKTNMLSVARKHGYPPLQTGDLADFVSAANYEAAITLFRGTDVIMAAGNHEFSRYVGEAWEDEEYKAKYLADAVASFPEGFLFGTHVRGGLRFLTLDNNYYYVTEFQLRRFRETMQDGVPTVLCVHNPLYSEDLLAQIHAKEGPDAVPYLFGTPEPLLRGLTEYRYKQQKPDSVTEEFLAFCNACPNLKAILAGHLHKGYESHLDCGTPQLVAPAAYRGEMNKVTFTE